MYQYGRFIISAKFHQYVSETFAHKSHYAIVLHKVFRHPSCYFNLDQNLGEKKQDWVELYFTQILSFWSQLLTRNARKLIKGSNDSDYSLVSNKD